MKIRLTVLMLLACNLVMAQGQKASTNFEKKSQTTTVSTVIHSDASTIMGLLTDAENFPKWNSTVVNIEGEIALGNKIKLTSTLDPDKSFKLKVTELTETSMKWSDGKGGRVFKLEKAQQGMVFTMSESLGGFFYPMYKKYLPSFDASFDQFAADLKKAAEAKNHHH